MKNIHIEKLIKINNDINIMNKLPFKMFILFILTTGKKTNDT